jgi:adenine-specific DNA-methyltransferase
MNMIYPRLYLARNLLDKDGVIFISIDERELPNLRAICNEVYGEECFVAVITLLCNPKGRSQDKYFATNHEYIVVYSKNILPKGYFSVEKDEEQIEVEYPEEDDGGKYRLLELRNTHREYGRHNRKNLYYPFYVDIESGDVYLEPAEERIEILPIWDDGFEGCWTWDRKKSTKDLDYLVARQVKDQWKIYRKSYASGSDKMLKTIFFDREFFTERGQKSFNRLFKTKQKIFQSPKSHYMISQLILTCLAKDGVILDFFAGSGSTAHSILELNKEDGGNRKFILVQLPEPTRTKKDDGSWKETEAWKAGFSTIAEITKERVRRVIKKLNDEEAEQLPINGKQDRGFRVFKLAESNFKGWDTSVPKDGKALEQQLELHIDHIREGRISEDILYEILLKSGFPLTTTVEKIELGGKIVYSVANGGMLICLEKGLTLEVVRSMAENKPQRVVCLDLGFAGNDQLKANAVQIFKTKDIVFKTV